MTIEINIVIDRLTARMILTIHRGSQSKIIVWKSTRLVKRTTSATMAKSMAPTPEIMAPVRSGWQRQQEPSSGPAMTLVLYQLCDNKQKWKMVNNSNQLRNNIIFFIAVLKFSNQNQNNSHWNKWKNDYCQIHNRCFLHSKSVVNKNALLLIGKLSIWLYGIGNSCSHVPHQFWCEAHIQINRFNLVIRINE